MPKHIISPVVEQSAREMLTEALRNGLGGDDPDGGTWSWLELVKPVLIETMEEIMQEELAVHLGAGKSEQIAQRRGYRNGSRKVTVKASTLGKLA